jgi:hypothetical protein
MVLFSKGDGVKVTALEGEQIAAIPGGSHVLAETNLPLPDSSGETLC